MNLLRNVRFFLHRPRSLGSLFLQEEPRIDAFDEEWGVQTSGKVRLYSVDTVGKNDIHGNYSQPIDPGEAVRALKQLPIPPREYTFVDFGSGKGRMLLIAGQFPFARVVGVEFSPQLVAVSRRNLTASRKPAAAPVEVVCADAAEWPLPPANSVFFFNNPFRPYLLERVLERIRASVAALPRSVYVLYFGPGIEHVRALFGDLEVAEHLFLVSGNAATASRTVGQAKRLAAAGNA